MTLSSSASGMSTIRRSHGRCEAEEPPDSMEGMTGRVGVASPLRPALHTFEATTQRPVGVAAIVDVVDLPSLAGLVEASGQDQRPKVAVDPEPHLCPAVTIGGDRNDPDFAGRQGAPAEQDVQDRAFGFGGRGRAVLNRVAHRLDLGGKERLELLVRELGAGACLRRLHAALRRRPRLLSSRTCSEAWKSTCFVILKLASDNFPLYNFIGGNPISGIYDVAVPADLPEFETSGGIQLCSGGYNGTGNQSSRRPAYLWLKGDQ